MKILFVSEVDLDGKSGQNIATNEIVSALARNKRIQLSLVCPKPTFGFSETVSNIKTKGYLPQRKPRSILWHIKQQFYMIKNLRAIIKKDKPDYIMARLGTSTFVTPLIAWFYKINYVLLIRGLPDFRRVSKIPAAHYYGIFLFYLNAKVASKVYVAYSEIKSFIDRFRKKPYQKAIILTNAVDIKKFFPIDRVLARKKMKLPLEDNDFVIGFAGSIKARHCLKELINAVGLVSKEIKIKCLIIGEGPELNSLKRLVLEMGLEETVHFTGFIPHDKLNTYLSACDLLYGAIHPSMVENPIKCYEYLACGRPIITSRKEEMKFVEDERLGILLQQNSPSEIKQAVKKIYNLDKQELAILERKARRYIENNHTWEIFVERIIKDL